jgi:hypothetical protein
MWAATNLHALSMNKIFVNTVVDCRFMFSACQGNASKPYESRVIYLEGVSPYYFFTDFTVYFEAKSNVRTSRPLNYLCNRRTMDEFPVLKFFVLYIIFSTWI